MSRSRCFSTPSDVARPRRQHRRAGRAVHPRPAPDPQARAYDPRVSPSPTFDTDPARLAQPFPADFTGASPPPPTRSRAPRPRTAGDRRSGTPSPASPAPSPTAAPATSPATTTTATRRTSRLMADLGARAYRFSVSWPRVLPTGTGAINQRGLDFYERLVDALLGAGIQPLVNLFHWDLPQALQDRGGFANPQVVGWFTDYAALLASTLGDRVKDWMTFNEPAVFAFLGHADGDPCAGPARLADGDPRRRQRAARPRRRRPGDPRPGRRLEDRRRDRRQPGRAGDRLGAGSGSPPASGAPLATRGSSIPCSAVATRRWDSRPTARRVTSTASSSPSRRPAISTTWA